MTDDEQLPVEDMCPHGMEGGNKPDPWLPGRRVACPLCARELERRRPRP